MKNQCPLKFLVFGTQRTGSSWLNLILNEYVKARSEHPLLLSEYFNLLRIFVVYAKEQDQGGKDLGLRQIHYPTSGPLFYFNYVDTKKGIEERLLEVDSDYKELLKSAHLTKIHFMLLDQEAKRRIEMLQKYEQKSSVIKLFSGDLRFFADLPAYLNKEYQIFEIKRKDKLKQILSFCLAEASGLWNLWDSRINPEFPDQKFEALEEPIERIARSFAFYETFAPKLNISKTVYYEDLLDLKTPLKILEKLGLQTNTKDALISPKIFPYEKHEDYFSYFSNAADVKKWIKKHFPGEFEKELK